MFFVSGFRYTYRVIIYICIYMQEGRSHTYRVRRVTRCLSPSPADRATRAVSTIAHKFYDDAGECHKLSGGNASLR